MVLRGRAKLSAKGQLVVPKPLREAAGLVEGDEVEMVFDGHRLVLTAVRRGVVDVPLVADKGEQVVEERSSAYAARAKQYPEGSGDRLVPSAVWADRVKALAEIERLRVKLAGVKFEDIWAEARRELEERGLRE